MDLQDTLQRLSTQFVARDIMKPTAVLTCGTDEADARRLLEENPQFDVIPIRQGTRLMAFLERSATKQRVIQVQHVVSAETPILTLVESFQRRRHVFVVGQHEVVGLVHLSDLNDPVVKLPFFLLLEGLERVVSDRIRRLVTEDALTSCIGDPDRVAQVRDKMAELRQKDADRDYVALLYFGEILRAGVRFGELRLNDGQIEDLAAVRKRVAHAATEELVESEEHVRQLGRVKTMCTQLLFGQEAA